MISVQVELGERAYAIDLIAELPGKRVAEVAQTHPRIHGKRCLVVTDSNVGPLYSDNLSQALREAGYDVHLFTIAAGESSKTLETLNHGLNLALDKRIGRQDFIVALGGGVVGDIAGLMASLLHRGIPIIQVPTSLLAQIDSSVGGKTAVNHPTGKNLIGTFWQPYAVVASQAVLKSLEPRHVRSGLAEGLKHAVIRSPELFAWIHEHATALRACDVKESAYLVEQCCRIKASVVAEDERDEGIRAILNFGHTLGHGYEGAAGYGALTHGEAVGIGMVLAAHLSHEFGHTDIETVGRITSALKELDLPHVPFSKDLPSPEEVLNIARSDKKGDGTRISFILIENIGSSLIRTFDWSQIEEALSVVKRRVLEEER